MTWPVETNGASRQGARDCGDGGLEPLFHRHLVRRELSFWRERRGLKVSLEDVAVPSRVSSEAEVAPKVPSFIGLAPECVPSFHLVAVSSPARARGRGLEQLSDASEHPARPGAADRF